MSRGPICRLCADAALSKRVAALIAQGDLADIQIAGQLGLAGHAGRVLVGRHRRNCIGKAAEALAKAAAKGRDVVERRKETIKSAEAGDDVSAFLGLEEITRDVRKVSKSLKRARKATENAGQYSIMTGIASQEHKNLELRGKLGNHTGFTPQKLAAGEQWPSFNLTINLSGQVQRISGTDIHPDATPVLDLPAVALPAPVEGNEDVEDLVEKVFAPAPEVEAAPRRGRPRRS